MLPFYHYNQSYDFIDGNYFQDYGEDDVERIIKLEDHTFQKNPTANPFLSMIQAASTVPVTPIKVNAISNSEMEQSSAVLLDD